MAFNQEQFDKEWLEKYQKQQQNELYQALKQVENKWESSYPQINTRDSSGRYETMIKVKETGAYTISWGGVGTAMSEQQYNIMAAEFKSTSDAIIDKWNAKYDAELAKAKGESQNNTQEEEYAAQNQNNQEGTSPEEIIDNMFNYMGDNF